METVRNSFTLHTTSANGRANTFAKCRPQIFLFLHVLASDVSVVLCVVHCFVRVQCSVS